MDLFFPINLLSDLVGEKMPPTGGKKKVKKKKFRPPSFFFFFKNLPLFPIFWALYFWGFTFFLKLIKTPRPSRGEIFSF